MVRHLPRLTMAALLSASSLLAGFGASGPGTVLAAESCPGTPRQANVNLAAKLTWLSYRETYDGGGSPAITREVTQLSGMPVGSVVFTYCVHKDANGRWEVMDPLDGDFTTKGKSSDFYNIGVINGRIVVEGGVGFALRAWKVFSRSVAVQPTMCRQNEGMKFLKELIGLPLPTPLFVSGLGWLIGHMLPDRSPACGTFMVDDGVVLPLDFAWDGDTTTDTWTRRFYHKTQIKTDNCLVEPRSCYDVDEYRWTITSY